MGGSKADAWNGAIKGEGGNAHETSALAVAGQNCPPVCFAIMARDLWGSKAPMVIGVQYRKRPPESDFSTERRWCRQEGDADAQVLITVLRSPEGLIALNRLMRDDPPDWWLNILVAIDKAVILDRAISEVKKL